MHLSQVLEDLVEEDDSNPHTWHVLGTAYYAGGMLEEAMVRTLRLTVV